MFIIVIVISLEHCTVVIALFKFKVVWFAHLLGGQSSQ